MPRAGFPYGHFVDSKCLRAGPRGFCLSPKGTLSAQTKTSLRSSNPNAGKAVCLLAWQNFSKKFAPHGI